MTHPLPLKGTRILVVEDDYLIAMDVCETLASCGAEIIGPATTMEQAAQLAEDTGRLDCIVLDLDLNGLPSIDFARALMLKAQRFVLVTGYDGDDILEELAAIPRVSKPFDPMHLCHVVESEIGRDA